MNIDIDQWIEKLKGGKDILEQKEVKQLCDKAIEIFLQESTVVQLHTPITVCGDVHGQFFDVLELFRKGGELPNTKYLFIGDYVDRGYNSVETMELLLCYKVKYPDRITLLRGNHESRQITQVYGFFEEISRKYGNSLCWQHFNRVFDYLPLGAIIDEGLFCVHGGLSPKLQTIDKIRTVDRVQEIPIEGQYADLMWSDPEDMEGWARNSRGAGYVFGWRPTKQFNYINGTQIVVRAHQLVFEGYEYKFDQNLVTVWSAPNYCYRMGNIASVMQVNEQQERRFETFEAVNQAQNIDYKKQMPYFL